MTSHTLRHFFISQAIMSSEASTFTIAKWVGHRGTRMIEEVHGHLRSGYRQEQMNSVRIIGTNPNGVVAEAQPQSPAPAKQAPTATGN